LNVYLSKKNVPSNLELINVNDAFFNANCNIPNNDMIKKAMLKVDKAQYIDGDKFLGRNESLGALNKENLSTGIKTLINIIENPDKCFNVIECGTNVQQFFKYINNGNILWQLPVVFSTGERKCDIMCNGKHFDDFGEFLDWTIDHYED
jgi:hypothetical protein